MKTSFLVCLIGVVIVYPVVSYNFGNQNNQYLRKDLQYDLANIARVGNSDSYSLNFNPLNAARLRNSYNLYKALRSSLLDSEDDYNHSAITYRNSDAEDPNNPSNIKFPDENGAIEEVSQIYDRSNRYNYMTGDPTSIDDTIKYQNECTDCLYDSPHKITQTEKRFGFPYGGYAGVGAQAGAYGGGAYDYDWYGYSG
ncbi:uncharacterized protein LOC111359200 [Spodoptera litura]|uniref:Uncharacterized protein LOC111359200 n=1 Tax=Spodoptera litura TaxID=69820 RepID=A0A9J7IX98_SPOLT|nr:uncharacterized protein LOC111359200 [Spodoptera litura]